ncbi:MAG: TetR/AcrR family transcriptional regulator [Mucilaginibacter sp.]
MPELIEIKEDSIQQQIIQAAQQLFERYGLHKVTMDDVAREIGKRRSSIYYYYKNKEEILDAAIDVEMRQILADINQAIAQAPTFSQKLNAYCIIRLRISQTRRALYTMIDSGMNIDDLPDFLKTRRMMHMKFRQMEIPVVRQMLDFGIAQGDLRAMTNQEQDDLILVLLSTLQGFKKEMVIKDNLESVEPGVKMLINLIINGFKG